MPDDVFGGGDVEFNPVRSISSSSPAFRLNSTFDPATGESSTSLSRRGTFPQQAFDTRFPRILRDIDTLRGTLRPGFSQLREARLGQVRNARDRAIGNLRENLRRRRVLGSSFAEDALLRGEAEFGQLAAEQEAQSFLEELDANTNLLNQESGQLFDALNRELQEAGLASNFSIAASDIFNRNAQFEAELDAQAAAGRGELFGTLAGIGLGLGGSILTGPAGGAAGGLIGRLLSPSRGGGVSSVPVGSRNPFVFNPGANTPGANQFFIP